MSHPLAVTDPFDPRVAAYRAVSQPSLARDGGFFVAEGRYVVERLLHATGFHVQSLLLNPAAHAAMAPLLAALSRDVEIFVGEPAFIETLTGHHIHQGCLAVADRPAAHDMATLVQSSNTLILLEACSNPDNVGAVFRNAAAFGVDGIVLSPGCADPFYRKAVRTSMAAVFAVPFAQAERWPDVVDDLKRTGVMVVATSPRQTATPLAQFLGAGRPRRVAVAFGAEGAGISEALFSLVDATIRVPIAASVDSLNVAVASGIVLARLSETPVSDTR